MFSSLLIANRGEIACRIARTAKAMGLRVVAVYSEADRDAAHVDIADTAHLIGPAQASQSYLNGDAIIAAAQAAGAEAIHPGYGFLAENADFAEAVLAAGLVWVGPPPSAIRAMGSKAEAKALMAAAGVPLVPGYHEADQDSARLGAAADEIGYPVLLKASAGGGGKGMRVVETAEALEEAIKSAQREARAGFGDDRLLVEKYLIQPRHIEMQVLADNAGHIVHLWERDCSPQRRHQKVIEEAPAPDFSAEQRAAMGAAAIAAARAVDYRGAGTVEFIVDHQGAFYFMEMNTRLQVEHPVTEMICGLDLVAWQLKIAAGGDLDFDQAAVPLSGHAIEARLYAEDPVRRFLPQTGQLHHLELPRESRLATTTLRVDAGVRRGDAVTIYYDPMIAKIIAHGPDRDHARRALVAALDDTEVVGVTTNRAFLARLLSAPAFAAGAVDTGFIERHLDDLAPPPAPATAEELALTTLWLWQGGGPLPPPGDPYSPWADNAGWRLNMAGRLAFTLVNGGTEWRADLTGLDGAWRLSVDAEGVATDFAVGPVDVDGATITAVLDGRRMSARVIGAGESCYLFHAGREVRIEHRDQTVVTAGDAAVEGHLTAPMPGRIIDIAVVAGTAVRRGDKLLVLEAMKMEHTIRAPAAGTVAALHVTVGEQVAEGLDLITFDAEEG